MIFRSWWHPCLPRNGNYRWCEFLNSRNCLFQENRWKALFLFGMMSHVPKFVLWHVRGKKKENTISLHFCYRYYSTLRSAICWRHQRKRNAKVQNLDRGESPEYESQESTTTTNSLPWYFSLLSLASARNFKAKSISITTVLFLVQNYLFRPSKFFHSK